MNEVPSELMHLADPVNEQAKIDLEIENMRKNGLAEEEVNRLIDKLDLDEDTLNLIVNKLRYRELMHKDITIVGFFYNDLQEEEPDKKALEQFKKTIRRKIDEYSKVRISRKSGVMKRNRALKYSVRIYSEFPSHFFGSIDMHSNNDLLNSKDGINDIPDPSKTQMYSKLSVAVVPGYKIFKKDRTEELIKNKGFIGYKDSLGGPKMIEDGGSHYDLFECIINEDIKDLV